MAGFRGPLVLLGINAVGSTAQGGFGSPLPVPPISAIPPVTIQGGFGSPLPVPPISAVTVVVTNQAGFVGVFPLLNMGARTPIIDDYIPEGGPSDGAVRQRLLDDDEVIIMIAQAFLTMVH